MGWNFGTDPAEVYLPPWPQTVGEVPDFCAERYPARTAFVVGESATTYAKWAARSRRVAQALLAQGLEPGERVAVLAQNEVSFFDAYTGIAQAGGVTVPIGNRLGIDELAFVASHSESRRLLFSAGTRAPAEAVSDAVASSAGISLSMLDLDDLPSLPTKLRNPPELRPTDLAAIFYTSGSTASPKGVSLSHRNVMACAGICARAFSIASEDVALSVLPLHHTATHFIALPTLVQGGTVVLKEAFDAAGAFGLLEQHRVTLFPTVTAMAIMMANHQRETGLDVNLSSLRKLFIGGSSVPMALIEQWQSFAPTTAVINTYGMTEMAPAISAMDPTVMPERLGTVGLPYPGNEVRIETESGNPAEPDDVGEILVRGPALMQGYFRNGAATAKVLRDGWLATGDLGFIDHDGYLMIVGRKKWVFKRGGENVFPDEVEDALIRHPEVREVVVLGVPDDVMGERIAAVVATHSGSTLTPAALHEWALERLASFKVPEFFSLVPEGLPRNLVGKVDVARLKTRVRDGDIEWTDLRRRRVRRTCS